MHKIFVDSDIISDVLAKRLLRWFFPIFIISDYNGFRGDCEYDSGYEDGTDISSHP